MILQLRIDLPSNYCYWAPPRGVGRNWYDCAPNASLILCAFTNWCVRKSRLISAFRRRGSGAGASPEPRLLTRRAAAKLKAWGKASRRN